MTIEEFSQIHQRYQMEKPKLFQLVHPDRPATYGQLAVVEREVGVRLPPRYREFLRAYGGGGFGLTNVFSADSSGEFYLPTKQAEASTLLPTRLLAISDDFSGGWYVVKVDDGDAAEPIFYWNADGGLVETEFSGFATSQSPRVRRRKGLWVVAGRCRTRVVAWI